MKLRYVVLVAAALAIGPVGYGKLIAWVMRQGIDLGYVVPAAALQIGLTMIAFPFFFGGVWVLANMEKYETFLKRVTR